MRQIIFAGLCGLFCTPFLYASDFYQAQSILGYQQQDSESSGAVTLLFPVWQRSDRLLLAQANQQISFNTAQTTSLDLAYRWLNDEQDLLWGLHAGYDRQTSEHGNHYQSANLGVELRSPRWHAYANAYLPEQKKYTEANYHQWALSDATDHNGFYHVYQKQGIESALLGGDANLGFVFWPALNATFYVGGFHYQASDVKTLTGPKAQLMFDLYRPQNTKNRLLDRITFSSMVQHDPVRKTNWSAGVNIVMNIGRAKHSLSTMQRYLQDPVPRSYGTLVRGNDARELEQLNNNQGNPFTVAKVHNATDINHAITEQANVIAVQGHIRQLNKIALNPGQDITGGDYVLSNGVTLNIGQNGHLSAALGEDLIQVSNNNRVENIILNTGPEHFSIINNSGASVGVVNIDNVAANSGFRFIINDGLDTSKLTITNNQLTIDNIILGKAIHLELDSGSAEARIDNNHLRFGLGEGYRGIYISASPLTDNTQVNLTVQSINNNVIEFSNGAGNTGIFMAVDDSANSLAHGTVKSIQNNQINFASGNDNTGIQFIIASLSNQGSFMISNIINNQVTFSSGTNLVGLDATAGYFLGTGTITIDTIYGNQFALPAGDSGTGFNFTAGTAPTTKIIIHTNANGLSLTEANHGALIAQQGNVVIDAI